MITVVKIGGHVLDDAPMLEKFCRDFAALQGPKVLVHGGGALASRVQKAMGIAPQIVEGRRITNTETLQIVTMVYAGWCNKHLTALLQREGCDAIGLSGPDAGVVTARKRPPIALSDGREMDFGFIGDVQPASVRTETLQTLLEAGLTPVLSPICHDGQGQLLNTNADTVAGAVASALGATLVYCFEKEGVLVDGKPLGELTYNQFVALQKEGTVSGGMLPKLEGAFKALQQGAKTVVIKSAEQLLDRTGTVLQ